MAIFRDTYNMADIMYPEKIEEAKIDWASEIKAAAADMGVKKKPVHAGDDDWSPKSTPAEKATNARKAVAQRGAEARAKVTRTVTRTKQYDAGQDEIINHEHEHATGQEGKNPHTTAAKALEINPWVPKVKVTKVDAAKAAIPKRPRGAGATAEAMKAYRAALRKHQAGLKEEVEQLDEVSAAAMGRAAEHEYNNQDIRPSAGPSRTKTITHQLRHPKTNALMYSSSDENKVNAMKKMPKFAGAVHKKVQESFDLLIVKEGLQYSYILSYEDDIIKEGMGITEAGIIAEANRFVNTLVEEVEQENNRLENVKEIIKSYINK